MKLGGDFYISLSTVYTLLYICVDIGDESFDGNDAQEPESEEDIAPPLIDSDVSEVEDDEGMLGYLLYYKGILQSIIIFLFSFISCRNGYW